jgi:hypothetical protein
MIRVLTLLVLISVAAFADAAPGDNPTTADPGFYGLDAMPGCWLICDTLNNTNKDVQCKPTSTGMPRWGNFDQCVFSISKAQTGCDPGPIAVQESDVFSDASPNVWHTIVTLTGIVTPNVSEQTLQRRPKKFIRTTQAAMSSAPCTDVDVMVCCQDLQSP